jgi:hypothetical protein
MSRADKYEKIERIGEGKWIRNLFWFFECFDHLGTYGTVYKARSLLTQEIVALKKVRLDDEDDVRFIEETNKNIFIPLGRAEFSSSWNLSFKRVTSSKYCQVNK